MLLEKGAEVTIVDKLQLAGKSWLWEAKPEKVEQHIRKAWYPRNSVTNT